MPLIEDYGMLGDLQSAALVGRDGSIDWLCLPRFDSPACFARLLGDADNGSWRIGPAAGGPCARRHYRGDSLVLETEWDTPQGSVRLIDLMPPRGQAPDVVRLVEGVSGRVRMRTDLRLRFDYGSIVPWVRREGDDLVAIAGAESVWLRTPVGLDADAHVSAAEFDVSEGQRVPFVLTYGPSYQPRPAFVDAETALRDTERYWSEWIGERPSGDRWDEAVRRSLVVLKALTYAPTGGIVAAATTSLPERLGGTRNWDYRYCWPRDAAFTLQALLAAGYVAEAQAWREWLLRAVAGNAAGLQTAYTVDGTRRMPEFTVDWLAGYEGSTPVRGGNAASGQFQLDLWGEILDALHQSRVTGVPVEEEAWDLQRALLDFLEGHWEDPDNGLWEIRGPGRHFVHSKVMAWAAMDRAVQAVERFGLDGPVERWRRLRGRIHADVCDRGFDSERGTFTQFYGSRGVDAALLLMPRVGFLPWRDPRMVGTVDAVLRELSTDGLVARYDPSADEGLETLPGGESAFVACSFWLADALHEIGRRDHAQRLFERLLDLRNDLGLLSEQYDPRARRLLGNTPQAFSHVGLVNTARRLRGSSMDGQ